MKIEGREVFRW